MFSNRFGVRPCQYQNEIEIDDSRRSDFVLRFFSSSISYLNAVGLNTLMGNLMPIYSKKLSIFLGRELLSFCLF